MTAKELRKLSEENVVDGEGETSLEKVYFYMKYGALNGATGCTFKAGSVSMTDLHTLQNNGFTVALDENGVDYKITWGNE